MTDEEHLQIIRQGVDVWNEWRKTNPALIPDLSKADLGSAKLNWAHLERADLRGANLGRANFISANLSGANLQAANLSSANLFEANLSGANLEAAILNNAILTKANLGRANLSRATLGMANLSGANLSGANLEAAKLSLANLSGANLETAKLSGANLNEANLGMANLSRANLSGAILSGTLLVRTDLRGASLAESRVYGAAVWDVKVNDQTNQQNLVITPYGEPLVTVDNIKVAQFVYLLLNNQEIRDVIDTITSKGVLILGRFSEDRKPVLDAIRNELRKPEHNYVPILFDFPPIKNQTTIQTVKILANMARFVIADLTDARSVLQELQAIVPGLPKVAVCLLIKTSAPEYGMLDDIRAYRSVVEKTFEYDSSEELIASIKENVIEPAEAKVKELRQK
jgi:uncharacterized protein YjbI with pentapeptide repeats